VECCAGCLNGMERVREGDDRKDEEVGKRESWKD
jgi:hypothetical protein